MRRWTETLVGGGLLLAGIGFGIGATQISSEAGYSGVGPNFLPWVVAVLLALCGALLSWQGMHGGFTHRDPPSGGEHGDWGGFAWVSAGILANALLITTVGFILSCTLCFVLAVRGFKRAEGASRPTVPIVLRDIAIGLAIAAPVYWMFTQLLAISLPGLTSTGWL